MKGKLITLEGTEGTGKSLQARLLTKYLKTLGYQVLLTREPGNSFLGRAIRRILLDPKNTSLDHTAELFLYLADRAQHRKEKIAPYLKKGYIIICDRFTDATVAYQGYGRKLPLKLINKMSNLATREIKPDLTIVLDVPVELGLRRAIKVGPQGGDRLEREKLKFHRAVRSGYLAIARKEPRRVKVIKARGAPREVQEKIREIVLNRI